jgi:hypothetical protein
MRILLFIILAFSFQVIAQDEVPFFEDEEKFESVSLEEPLQFEEPVADSERIPCDCPAFAEQAGETVPTSNDFFPNDAVFLITPYTPPTAPIQQQEQPEPKKSIPGYIEELPSGYSDESYLQIPAD